MLSKNHPHRGPLWRSVAYFTITGFALISAGSNLVSISVLFKLVGFACILLGGIAFKSLICSKPYEYEYLGVFSMKNQKLIRFVGLSLPWMAIAVGLFSYYAASTSAENHLSKAADSGIHIRQTRINLAVITAFARKVTRHLVGIDAENYVTYTKMLLNEELSPRVARKLKENYLLPSNTLEMNAILENLSIQKRSTKTKIQSSNIVGMTKEKFMIVDVEFTTVETSGNTTTLTPGKLRYHIGIWSKNKKPVVADMMELPAKYAPVTFEKPDQRKKTSALSYNAH